MIYHWFLWLVRLSLLSGHILVLFFSGIWFDREAQPKVLKTPCPKSLSISLSTIITIFYYLLLAYGFCPRSQAHPLYLCLFHNLGMLKWVHLPITSASHTALFTEEGTSYPCGPPQPHLKSLSYSIPCPTLYLVLLYTMTNLTSSVFTESMLHIQVVNRKYHH